MSDEVQDLGKKVGQVAEDGVMFLDEVLHDLGIDRCLPDIFGQCVGSYPTGILLGVGVFI